MRRIFWLFGVLPLLLVCLWLVGPRLIRQQLHQRHPEVTFGALDVGWRELVLHDVLINKGWVQARASLARVNIRTEAVHLVQGTLDIDFDKRPVGRKSEQPNVNVTAERFEVVLKKGVNDANGTRRVLAVLHGVDVDEKAILAREADVTYADYRVHIGSYGVPAAPIPGVEIARDLTQAKIALVTFPEGLTLPKALPPIVNPSVFGINVDIENRTVRVMAASFELAEDPAKACDVQWANLSLHGDKVRVDMEYLNLSHPWLGTSGGSLGFHSVAFEIAPNWRDPLDVKIGPATIHIDPSQKSVSGDEPCASWVQAIPYELGYGPMQGDTQWDPQSRVKFSVGLVPKPHFHLEGTCSTSCDDVMVKQLRHRFAYHTYDEKGVQNHEDRYVGPDDPDWVPLSEISSNMLEAVTNTEDWAFWSHHGYVPAALEQSFLADVDSGKFTRGGSTITMQLAKNIFLTRDKTLVRKVKELFLSQVLESCFTKKEILELYLNVVEFGPNIYGLRQGADHYFQVEPRTLDPAQAFYLAWILPRPRKAPPPNAATLGHMNTLMHMLAKEGRLSETMLLGVEEPDTTGWAAP